MIFANNLIRKHWFSAVLLLLAASLRFYRAEDLFVFSGDEEHQMSIAYSIVKNFHIEWVGVSSADTGFYLGPFWMYFGAFWLFLSQGNPAILAYIAALIGVLTTLAVFFVGIKIFNKTIAGIAAFFYATLPLIVYYDKKFWNPSLTSLVSLILFYSLYKALNSPKWWVIVGLVYGFVFHVHLSLVPLGLLIIIFAVLNIKKINPKNIVLALVTFLLLISPLIAFDYFTAGRNLLAPVRIYFQVSKQPSRIDPLNHFYELLVTISRFWYLYPNRESSDEVLHSCSLEFLNKQKLVSGVNTTASSPVWILSIFSFSLLLFFLFQKATWKNNNTRHLSLFLTLLLICYIFLPNIALEYYLLGFFPLFIYIPGIIFERSNKFVKILFIISFPLVLVLSINTILTAKDSFGLSNKKSLITQVGNFIGPNTFELEEVGVCHKFEGWRFLYRAYFKTPLHSSEDQSLGWIYESEIGKEKGFYKVIMAETRADTGIYKNYIAKFNSGGFTAYIFNN